MQYDDFIGEVQHRAQLDSREAALNITRATLLTLSERVQPGDADNLGAQLPEEIGRFLETVDDVERFGMDEFVDRVADREEIGEAERPDIVFHAQVVLDVVEEAVTDGALEDVREQLPAAEYEDLFEVADSEGTPA